MLINDKRIRRLENRVKCDYQSCAPPVSVTDVLELDVYPLLLEPSEGIKQRVLAADWLICNSACLFQALSLCLPKEGEDN